MFRKYTSLAGLICLFSCTQEQTATPLFEALPASETGVTFENRILDKKEQNIFNYRNFYNGGGVAVGDVNGDGWADIFCTSNFEQDRLYLNKGNKATGQIQFDDITGKAGVGGTKAWSTGATFADVNGDGLMDIYVCNSGNIKGDKRGNELFINNGNGPDGVPTFTERAAEYGLVDGGFSTHAAFFDYDRDGDLDMYLLNNSFTPVDKLGYRNFRAYRDKLGGDKLFKNLSVEKKKVPNQQPLFVDVSEEAGIYGSLIGFGLGITIGDVNEDNWPDIYISNDFYERDYLYINQRNGTFKESIEQSMNHISLSSMGADIADINNDGHLDIFVTDMLPQDDIRLKTTSVFEGYDLTQYKLRQDYWHQYMRNMLHLNNGDNNGGTPTFTEVAQMGGVHATDWSWGALLFDMDNDGLKDIFVANGIVKNLTDQDYVAFLADEKNIQDMIEGKVKFEYKKFVDMISSSPIPNYAFHNKGSLQFDDKAKDWGLGEPGFSNGAAYGDLDNDGDLDLVVNNNNAPLSIYRNHSTEKFNKHYLRVALTGGEFNRQAIGARVYVHQKDKTLYLQQMPNRGFQSSSDHVLVFGLGNQAAIDSVTVIWPDLANGQDKMQVIRNPKADQTLQLAYKAADRTWTMPIVATQQTFTDLTTASGLSYRHVEDPFVDYNRDGLLKQMYSTQGPAMAIGDVNGDGLDDVYFGGSVGGQRGLFIQKAGNTFAPGNQTPFASAMATEEVDALFFDADGDKDLDLYVVTGSNEFFPEDAALADRLYTNDGNGNFTLSTGSIPNLLDSGSCASAGDFDHDGDLDLFVGSRLVPTQYGTDPTSRLLINDGKGHFRDLSSQLPQNGNLGMVTDASWNDLDADGFVDLMLVGDWMPVTLLRNRGGKSLEKATIGNLNRSSGWWNCLHPADLDGDGDLDFVLGNLGRNSRLVANRQEPAELFVNDFDRNGTTEQIITCYTLGKPYPMVLKPDLQKVLPVIKKKFVKHTDYAGKSINDVFTPEQMQGVTKKTVYEPNTCILWNKGNGEFTLSPLPYQVQVSPVYGIETIDFDHDGKLDILLTGNFFDVLPELGRYDANFGLVAHNAGKGKNGETAFTILQPKDTGFRVTGQVRHMATMRGANKRPLIIIAKNSAPAQLLTTK